MLDGGAVRSQAPAQVTCPDCGTLTSHLHLLHLEERHVVIGVDGHGVALPVQDDLRGWLTGHARLRAIRIRQA